MVSKGVIKSMNIPGKAKIEGTTGHQILTLILKLIVEQISGKIWHNRGFNDKSVKTSKIVHLDLLNKIGYGPIV